VVLAYQVSWKLLLKVKCLTFEAEIDIMEPAKLPERDYCDHGAASMIKETMHKWISSKYGLWFAEDGNVINSVVRIYAQTLINGMLCWQKKSVVIRLV